MRPRLQRIENRMRGAVASPQSGSPLVEAAAPRSTNTSTRCFCPSWIGDGIEKCAARRGSDITNNHANTPGLEVPVKLRARSGVVEYSMRKEVSALACPGPFGTVTVLEQRARHTLSEMSPPYA